jgi:hypothetical protein
VLQGPEALMMPPAVQTVAKNPRLAAAATVVVAVLGWCGWFQQAT